MSMFIVAFIVGSLSITLSSATGTMMSFGLVTSSDSWAATTGTVSVILWKGGTIYQCCYNCIISNTEYLCSNETWNISTGADNDGSSDYKLLIENNAADSVVIESAFLRLNDGNYSIDGWCIPNSQFVHSIYELDSAEHPNVSCLSGFTAYDNLCIDNETGDCGMYHYFMPNADLSFLLTTRYSLCICFQLLLKFSCISM